MENFNELDNNTLELINGGNGWATAFKGAVAVGIGAAFTAPVIGPAAAVGITACIVGGQIMAAIGVAEGISGKDI